MSVSDDPAIEDAIVERQLAEERVNQAEYLLQFFSFGHLRDELKAVSRAFAVTAVNIVTTLPRNPERTVALRKLKEAKDAAVCAKLFK
jgi:hypothetical protein